MNIRHICVLARFGFLDLWMSRVIPTIFLSWLLILMVSFGVNLNSQKEEAIKANQTQKAMVQYFQSFPNPNFLFGTLYTVQRPPSPLSFLAQGASYMAPNFSDYLARYSPNFYYSDDTNILFRLSKPFDLTIIIGIIGSLIALVVTYQAINGEIIDKNFFLLELSGVSSLSRYAAKWLVFQSVIIGSFILAYLVSLMACSQYFSITLLPDLPALFMIGFISVILLMLSVSLGLAVSSLTLSPQKSFSLGIAFFLMQVFILPLLTVEVQPLLGNEAPSATDLQENKVFYSRLIHRRLDPYTYNLKKRFQSAPLTAEMLSTAWHEDEKRELFTFVNTNSNYAMLVDREFFDRQASYAKRIFQIAQWVSPFFAYQSAITELANTGIESERLLVKEVTWDHFAKYRKWFWDSFLVPMNWNAMPSAKKWIFVPATKSYNIEEMGTIKRPTLSFLEKISAIWSQILSLIIWSLFLIFVGLKSVQSLNDRGST